MNGVQTRFKCKLDVKRCKRFVFPPSSLLPRSNALKTKAIRYFQTDRTLTRIVSPPLLAFAGCSDDYTDATSKHIYGENENPYLKTNTNAQVTTNVALEVNGRHAYVLNLSDYTNKFEELMGMSVDAAVAGLDTKATVFYPINMTRNQWLKTAYTKDGAGWYFNSVGQPCSADDADGKATVTLDKAAKTLNVELTEGGIVAGTVFTLNVGFAVNGPDYDDYVRFTFEVGVTDPTVSVVSVAFSSDNATVTLPVEDYKENIETVFDMSIEEFLAKAADNTDIKFCLADPSTGEWSDMGENYTANAPGYWMNTSGEAVSWGTDGYAAYIEYYSSDEACGVGYNDGLAVGTTGKMNVGWVDMNDTSKYFRFVINYTVE